MEVGFIETIYGKMVVLAGAAATLWGLCKAIGALRTWLKAKYKSYQERSEMPKKTLELLLALKAEMADSNRCNDQRLLEITTKLGDILTKQEFTEEQVATMQNEKLCWAYMYYGKQQHPIPLQTKLSLERMYIHYTDSGRRNHVPDDWQTVMDSASVEGSSR